MSIGHAWVRALCLLWTVAVHATEATTLTCAPTELRGRPGDPLRVELSVASRSAQPARFLIPSVSNLTLRVVEKLPLRRARDGTIAQERVVFWQGVEAGEIILTNLTVEIAGARLTFPPLRITIDPVAPLEPPDFTPLPTKGSAP